MSVPAVLPKCIGSFQIEGLYSQGGMSSLLLAHKDDFQTKVIIKILLPQFISDADLVDRFINEGKILSMSHHRNIVRLYEYGYFSDGPYIAMEFISGTSLNTILKMKQLTIEEGLKIFLEVCQGIRHLHAHGIIHGDIKPENILLDSANVVKIVDFGIAKFLNAQDVIERERFVGSPFYMAPEVQRDYRHISVQSDIYSLGVVGYELLVSKISKGLIDTQELPMELGEIIDRALAKDLSERYKTVEDLISDLSSYMLLHNVGVTGYDFDYYFKVYGQLQKRHAALLESLVPPKGGKIGVSYHYTPQGDGLYFKCLDDLSEQTVIVAQSVRSKTEGIFDTLRLHEMLKEHEAKTDSSITVKDVVVVFEGLLNQGADFIYCFFNVQRDRKRIQWAGHGLGMLFLIHEGVVCPIGLANQTFQQGYFAGDRFVIVSGPIHSEGVVALLVEALSQVAASLPEEVSKHLVETIRGKGEGFFENHQACIVAVYPDS